MQSLRRGHGYGHVFGGAARAGRAACCFSRVFEPGVKQSLRDQSSEPPNGPIGGGGFDSRSDVNVFRLGIEYGRARHLNGDQDLWGKRDSTPQTKR